MGNWESPPLMELWLSADPKDVPVARKRAMQVCTDSGLADDDCFRLDLALGEALANAVIHGAPLEADRADPHVFLSLWRFDDRLVIHIEDKGPGFEPPAPPYKMPLNDWSATSGRGLPLMETLTDAMVVCRADADRGGACVYLVKNIGRG